ncbi:MAG TPA: putative collagen-binding domain-containing protein [bacterium]|nr:putative collagen-binding domain-containing protein [bacterium]
MKRLRRSSTIIFILMTLAIGMGCSTDNDRGYLPGQIILDPDHPDRLVYNRDANNDGELDPFFMCGPGGPEGFLYGDISGGYSPAMVLDTMIVYGGNCIYMQGIRSHGGDGTAEQNPFVNNDPQQGIDTDMLKQWEEWFQRMEEHGIVIYFYFYDDEVKIGPENEIIPVEREYITTVVNAFEHHPNLIWVVAEEYQEIFSKEKVSRIAELIRRTDDHNHLIASHQLPSLEFHHADDPVIDQFAMQLRSTEGPYSDIHNKCLQALENANGRYHVNLAEQYDWHSDLLEAGDREGVRKINWSVAITGMHIMHLGAWETTRERRPPSVGMLQDSRHVYEFMEAIPDLNEMKPQDQLVESGTAWVLGTPDHYLVYLIEGGTISLNLQGDKNSLQAQWYNPRTGEYSDPESIIAGRQQFTAPDSNDWILHISG